jgi:dUTP pyrophosphatase
MVALPVGVYGRIAPCSGLAWKHSIDVGAGVVGEDYRGNVSVVLYNHSDIAFEIKVGRKVAQLILEKIEHADVEERQSLTTTVRGNGGFGSTG